MINLKNYQEKAIKQLYQQTVLIYDNDDQELDNTIVFQSPTGSGKTVILTKYIEEMCNKFNDICFLWISIGSGDLHNQSKRSVKRNVSNKVKLSLVEDEFTGERKTIQPSEVVFVNWEKIRNKDKQGAFTNVLMKDIEKYNFVDVLNNTRESGIKIILIIDESHVSSSTTRAMELRDGIIKPYLTIEASATPVLTQYMTAKVSVPANKVIEEGMIKKEVIINADIDEVLDDEISSDNLVLEAAFSKLEELKQRYLDIGSNVNPLALIQLPNSNHPPPVKPVSVHLHLVLLSEDRH